MYADKYAHSINDIPIEEHWAIIKNESITIPGDERSRTAPGHGYPEHIEHYFSYEIYYTEEKFKQALADYFHSRWDATSVRGVHVNKSYTQRVSVEVVENKKGA